MSLTIAELLVAMCAASDNGDDGIGVYQAAVTNASRDKRGLTTLTFKIKVGEFDPAAVLNPGLGAWIAVGRKDVLQRMIAAAPPTTGDQQP